MLKKISLTALLWVAAFGSDATIVSSTPPDVVQEFRGVWIATVNNTDWPSRPGLTTDQQKAELLNIFDHAVRCKLNAVIFQVRPQCDALYASSIEPWSEYLTGAMGKAPSPYYDPLAFAVEEAHKRGLELHAWFNPYRALHFTHAGQVASNHISRTHPELVRSYGKYLSLDPGEPEVQNHIIRVVMDVVKRYDVDGVQFDDYFYITRRDAGATTDFPDNASWKKYGRGDRGDWRRANVDSLIQRTYREIKMVKPWVKFGVSPRGIWRPNFPAGIKGMDAYADQYADSRKWLMNQWVDYLAPQLYWPIDPPDQSFRSLLSWWAAQAEQKRHVWPGIRLYNIESWSHDEIPNQIRLARNVPGVRGYIFYNATNLMRSGLGRTLAEDLNAVPATPAPFVWLAQNFPTPPTVTTIRAGGSLIVRWSPTYGTVIRYWVVQTFWGNGWRTEVLPGSQLSEQFNSGIPQNVFIRAVDRVGMISGWSVVQGNSIGTGVEVADKPARKPSRMSSPRMK